MFEQVVGNGANEFFIILAIIIGFVAGLSFVDSQQVKKQQEEQNHH